MVKPTVIPANISAGVSVFNSFLTTQRKLDETYKSYSQRAMREFCIACVALGPLSPDEIVAISKRAGGESGDSNKKAARRVMRAICEPKAQRERQARANALAKASNIQAASAMAAEKNWGPAVAKDGTPKKIGKKGGRPNGAAQAKGAKESEAITGLRKLTQSGLIEFIAARAAKSPSFRAALLTALHAQDAAETETETE